MFSPEDFQIPLEKQLRLRVINQEIDECNDPEILKTHLKQCTETLMKYQHLLSMTLKNQIDKEMREFISKIDEVVKQHENGS